MGVGAGVAASLRVDPETLANIANQMVTAAKGLPDKPDRFTESGADPLSQAISGMLPGIEDPIQQLLPKVKAEAEKTASNMVAAAGHYQTTDEQLAAKYDAHQFDGSGGAGAGGSGSGGGSAASTAAGGSSAVPAGASAATASTAGAGSGGGSDAMSQMMSTPMQMASQAAQMPMKAMGALSSLPQTIMQGVQQVSQMAGGTGSSDEKADQQGQPDKPDAEKGKQNPEQGAAPGETKGERAPGVQSPSTAAVPQPSSGRQAVPDPSVNL